MPGPLVCEGPDLERLLAQVNAQPGAQILYQDRIRRGGVGGFFAREVHRIAYRVADDGVAEDTGAEGTGAEDVEATTGRGTIEAWAVEPAVGAGSSPAAELYGGYAASQPTTGTALVELDELLASAEAAESAGGAGQHRAPEPAEHQAPEQPAPWQAPAGQPIFGQSIFGQPIFGQPIFGQSTVGPAAGQPDFAALLRTLTEADPEPGGPVAADPVGNVASGREPAVERLARPAPKPAHASNVTTIGKPDARARLEMLMQLRQVGVPVSVNPRADTHTLYEALESILEDLPAPAVPPRGAGEVLAVVGESGPALQAARTCAAMLRIPADGIGVAGLTGTDYPVISGQAEALRLRTELRRADLPSIVVIATDPTVAGPDDPWAAEMLAALCPTAVWAVVDARWKTEDSRAQLDRLGPVDALVVHSAQLSASPASVWDLDLPLGLLDGRAASAFAWTGLLFPLLRGDARHRASA